MANRKTTRRRGKSTKKQNKSLGLESLEARQLLAADLTAIGPVESDLNAQYGVVDSSTTLSLEPRADLVVDGVTAGEVEQSYTVSGRQVGLIPVEGAFAIGINASAKVGIKSITDQVGGFGELAGGNAVQINSRMVTLEGTTRTAAESQLDQLAAASRVDKSQFWIAPVYRNAEAGLRQWLTDDIVVKLQDGVDPETFFADSRFDSFRPMQGTTDQFVATISAGGGLGALEIAENELSSAPNVVWASVDFISEVVFHEQPNDPLFSQQWHLHNTGQSGGTVDADADLVEAWDESLGDGVVIAILDDGVDTSHPDLNIWTNPGEIPGNGLDDDGNGWVDDVNGINLVDGASPPTDNPLLNNPNPSTINHNHGTAVAGVAASRTDNSLGTAGAGRNAQIMPIRWAWTVPGGFILSTDSGHASAVLYAAGRNATTGGTWRGADVSVHSYSENPSTTEDSAYTWAATNGRNGLGLASFAATGNGASGYNRYGIDLDIPFNVFNSGAQVRFRYVKDGSGSAGEDAAWIANIEFPDGSVNRFDTWGDLEGWTGGGDVPGGMVDDPWNQHGTGRYTLFAGNIGDNQDSTLLSPEIEQSGEFSWSSWISSQRDDPLQVYVRYRTGTFGEWGDWEWIRSDDGVPDTRDGISYPASIPTTIAVGASTDFDYRSDYSQFGAGLDIVAPSSGGFHRIVTTDRTGAPGYVPGSYTPTGTGGFGGTSSATPLAAGVAALMIADNPDATAAQIRTALQDSAAQVGRVDYNTSGWSQFYGHGRLDADGALGLIGEDSNDTISEAQLVSLDSMLNGRIGSGSDVDIYELQVSAGTRVGFDLDNDAGDLHLDTFLRLMDSSGNEIAQDDDTNGPLPEVDNEESYLEYTFTTGGTYYVGVSEFRNRSFNALDGENDSTNSRTGNYRLNINDLTDDSLLVTETGDAADGVTFNGVTLREAVAFANSQPGSDDIFFDTSGIFSTSQTITLTNGELAVTDSLSINGPFDSQLTISGGNNSRVFNFEGAGGNSHELNDLTITDGNASDGGGIRVSGDILTINRSTIRDSFAAGKGGGLEVVFGATLNLNDSTVSNNQAGDVGGVNVFSSAANFDNSTISGNSATSTSALSVFGTAASAEIHNSTIANNFGGIRTINVEGNGNVLRTKNSIFDSPTDNLAATFGATITSLGFNLSNDDSGNLAATGDIINTDPMLGPLANNGAFVMTHALMGGSPAINAGDPGIAASGDGDQNGNDRVIGGIVDIGSVESNPAVVRTLGSIPEGMSTQSAYDLRTGEVVFYRFDLDFDVLAANGHSLVMDTLGTTLAPDNDTELGLYDSAGNRIADNDDIDFGSGNSLSQLTFGDDGTNGDLSAGTYYLAMGSFDTAFGNTGFDVTSGSTNSGDIVVNFNLNGAMEAPTFTSPNTANVAENSRIVHTLTANDGSSQPITFAIANQGADSGLFELVGSRLQFKAAPDFETAVDADQDNIYEVTVQAVGAGGVTDQTIQVTVADLNDGPKVAFVGTHRTGQIELFRSDGTNTFNTGVLKNVAGNVSSNPHELTVVGDRLYFAATAADGEVELFSTLRDGTTRRVKDLAGDISSNPHELTEYNGLLYFVATGPDLNTELYATNGTNTGTVRVKNLSGNVSADPRNLVVFDGKLYFTALSDTGERELYSSDGTGPGTGRVVNLYGQATSSNPSDLTVVGNQLYFLATNSDGERELHQSDGTAAGTMAVTDLDADLSELTVYDGHLSFIANMTDGSSEIHLTDNAGGTQVIGSFSPGVNPRELTTSGSQLFFVATTNNGQNELHVYNGSSIQLLNLHNATDANPQGLKAFADKVYFSAVGNDGEREFYASDGTPAGTFRVRDLAGTASSNPRNLTAVADMLYFSATLSNGETELFRSDGTTAGTFLVKNLAGSPNPYEIVAFDFDITPQPPVSPPVVAEGGVNPGGNGSMSGDAPRAIRERPATNRIRRVIDEVLAKWD